MVAGFAIMKDHFVRPHSSQKKSWKKIKKIFELKTIYFLPFCTDESHMIIWDIYTIWHHKTVKDKWFPA
jgi:hypothetical protein